MSCWISNGRSCIRPNISRFSGTTMKLQRKPLPENQPTGEGRHSRPTVVPQGRRLYGSMTRKADAGDCSYLAAVFGGTPGALAWAPGREERWRERVAWQACSSSIAHRSGWSRFSPACRRWESIPSCAAAAAIRAWAYDGAPARHHRRRPRRGMAGAHAVAAGAERHLRALCRRISDACFFARRTARRRRAARAVDRGTHRSWPGRRSRMASSARSRTRILLGLLYWRRLQFSCSGSGSGPSGRRRPIGIASCRFDDTADCGATCDRA